MDQPCARIVGEELELRPTVHRRLDQDGILNRSISGIAAIDDAERVTVQVHRMPHHRAITHRNPDTLAGAYLERIIESLLPVDQPLIRAPAAAQNEIYFTVGLPDRREVQTIPGHQIARIEHLPAQFGRHEIERRG